MRTSPTPFPFLIAVALCLALLALATAAPAAAQSRKLKPLSSKDATEFGEKIEKAIAERNASVLDSAVDIEALLERVMEGLGDADAIKDDLRAALKETLVGPDGLAASILRELGPPTDGGSYRFLRARAACAASRNCSTASTRQPVTTITSSRWRGPATTSP